jgi:small subunit ribosomal protein S17
MKTIVGQVISTKMNKTVVIERQLTKKHALYKKLLTFSRRVKARSDMPLVVGDRVKLKMSRPLSKDVHYVVVEKLS